MDQILSRIKVDLSDFYKDERKSCMKSLDYRALKKVSDLKNYIVTEMGIPDQTQLLLRNSILFGSDDLRVIRDGDELKLVRCNFGCSVPSTLQPRTTIDKFGRPEQDSSSSSDSEDDSSNKATAAAVPEVKDMTCAVDNIQNELMEEGLEWMKEPLPKRKRTRKRRSRKNKGSPEQAEVHREVKTVTHKFMPLRRPEIENVNERRHFRFGEEVEDNYWPSVKPRTNGHSDQGKVDKAEGTNGAEVMSPMDLGADQPVVFRRSFKQPEAPKVESRFESMSEQEIFDLPPVTEAPKEGEILAFRLLYLSESYVPELSNWLVGKVDTTVDGNLGFQLLRGVNPRHKRENEGFDEVDDEVCNEREDYLTASFEDLAMPRLLPSGENSV